MRGSTDAPVPGLWSLARRRHALHAALRISGVVGTVLNLVNNGPAWWDGQTVSWWKVAMNYVVPFCVASYSAARQEQRRLAGQATPEGPDLGLHEGDRL